MNVLRACGRKPLKGVKTTTFALALAGDEDAIVIDTWIMKIFNRHSARSGELRHIPTIIRKVAKAVDMTPAQTQACLWTYAKTELNGTRHKEMGDFATYLKEKGGE